MLAVAIYGIHGWTPNASNLHTRASINSGHTHQTLKYSPGYARADECIHEEMR